MLNTGKLAGKTLYITGASRGIGKSIALKAAQDGANIVVAAKTAEPHPKLPGTIFTAAKESKDSGSWYVDLKNGSGSVGSGQCQTKADCTLTMEDANFHQMFEGKLKPTMAFMSGKLKIAGDTGKALKLEKLLGAMSTKRGYHTSAGRWSSEDDIPLYTSVPQAFERISTVVSDPAVRSKVNAIFLFDIEGEGKYYIDLKTGEGKVGKGDPETKADVTITMNSNNMIKLFNRELKPATAFMTGQLKLSGDLAKAMALEGVMKAARGIKDYSTWARRRHFRIPSSSSSSPRRHYSDTSRIDEPRGWPLYSNTKEVFARIEEAATEEFIKDIQAHILFDLTDIGKFYIDLKTGPKAIILRERTETPDLTVKVNSENFLKVFNLELLSGDSFIEGIVAVKGDIKVALKLETFLKDVRAKEDAAC